MPHVEMLGRSVELAEELILGRHRNCGLQVPDQAASRQHARVFAVGEEWFVEDLGSNNGTTVDGAPVTSRLALGEGARIRIGTHEIVFRQAGAAAPTSTVAPDNPIALVGRNIAGYELTGLIAKGPTGVVYAAKQVNLQREVAFKVISPGIARDDGYRERFLHEAGLACSVQDDGLVRVHESGHDADRFWYSMELVKGENFDLLLGRDGTIDPVLALLVGERIATALLAAHARKVYHRDLRPAVILLTPDGTVKLCELGLAEVLGRGRRLLMPKLRPGTPASSLWYLSPEQLDGEAGDARSDVYGLGCVLFHLLAGRPPFAGANAAEVVQAHRQHPIPSVCEALPGLPRELDTLLSGMLAKNPEWRFADCRELAGAMRKLREQVAAAPPIQDRSGIARAAAKRAAAREERAFPWAMLLLALGVLGAIAALVLYLASSKPAPAAEPEPQVVRPLPAAQPAQPVRPPEPTPVVAPVQPRGEDSLTARWQTAKDEIERLVVANDWGAAEQAIERTLAAFTRASAPADLIQQVRLRRADLDDRGQAWYRSQLNALPSGDDAATYAARLKAMSRLRDIVLAAQRPDAELLYQVALTHLNQQLSRARRDARKALEAGMPERLPAIAAGLEAGFLGTPVQSLQRQFGVLCDEAARLKPLGLAATWQIAAKTLPAEQALAVAAAWTLAGDAGRARAALTSAQGFDKPDLIRRRAALAGRQAAILSFDDIADLHVIDVALGQPRLQGGVLTGAPGEAVSLACTVPVGGPGWDAGVSLTLTDVRAGEAVVSVGTTQQPGVAVHIGQERIEVLARDQGATAVAVAKARRPAGTLRLRLSSRAGALTMFVNDQQIALIPRHQVVPDSQVRFEANGLNWKLDDLQVIGGD